jgi:hypothetical protein
MGYGKYQEPTLSKRFTSRKWSSERLDKRRKMLELGTKQADITKLVEKTKRDLNGV